MNANLVDAPPDGGRFGIRRLVIGGKALCAATAALAMSSLLTTSVLAVTATAPGLGVATSFAVLGGSTVTNTGPSVISGDLGVSPGSAVTGFPPGTVVNGTIHAGDAMATQAQSDLTTAYNSAAGQKPCTDETGKVLGQDVGTVATPLPPGVYCFSTSAQLTGALHLSGAGVYIFQIGSTLTTASGSSVVLDNNASACQIFWQVGSSATIGTTTSFDGTIMALASITVNNGVVIHGRALARTGQVSLINDTVTRPTCGQAASSTTLTSSPNPSGTGQPVIFTATVPGGAGGTVTFYDGTTRLGSASVDGSGHATFTTSTLGAGKHSITAVFSGTPARLPSSSPPLIQTVLSPTPPTASPPNSLVGAPNSGGGQPAVANTPRSVSSPPWALFLLAVSGVGLFVAGRLRSRR